MKKAVTLKRKTIYKAINLLSLIVLFVGTVQLFPAIKTVAAEEHRHYMLTYIGSGPYCSHEYHLEDYHKCLICGRYYQFDTKILWNREYADDFYEKAAAFASEYNIKNYEPNQLVITWDLEDYYVAQYEVSREQLYQLPIDHSYGDWQTERAASCISSGSETRTCSACGHFERRNVEKTDHKYGEWTVETEAGCESEGLMVRSCALCHKQETQTIDATGHAYSDWEIITEPGCDSEGTEIRTCANCQNQETRSIPATGHSFGEWEICSAEEERCGSMKRTCSICGFIETDDSNLADHSFGEWEVVTDPTCQVEGLERHICQVCGKTEDRKIPETGHTFDEWQTVTESGCLTLGEEKHTCSRCGFTEVRETDALGHSYSDWETVAEPGCTTTGAMQAVCIYCGDTLQQDIVALGHSWEGEYTVDKEATTEADGSMSIHCSACDERKDITAIPAIVLPDTKSYTGPVEPAVFDIPDNNTIPEEQTDIEEPAIDYMKHEEELPIIENADIQSKMPDTEMAEDLPSIEYKDVQDEEPDCSENTKIPGFSDEGGPKTREESSTETGLSDELQEVAVTISVPNDDEGIVFGTEMPAIPEMTDAKTFSHTDEIKRKFPAGEIMIIAASLLTITGLLILIKIIKKYYVRFYRRILGHAKNNAGYTFRNSRYTYR